MSNFRIRKKVILIWDNRFLIDCIDIIINLIKRKKPKLANSQAINYKGIIKTKTNNKMKCKKKVQYKSRCKNQ